MTYDLSRFHKAQELDFEDALAELRAGRKKSHWIWYVFPQLRGLGMSAMADYYGIDGKEEAEAYLADDGLRKNLVTAAEALLALPVDNPVEVMGSIDAIKLRSSMTLFAEVKGTDPSFAAVLDKYYGGERDPLTLKMLAAE